MFDQSNPVTRLIRRFDFFPKYESEVIVRSGTGGIGTRFFVLAELILRSASLFSKIHLF